jgi:paraquat-inducible protein B
VRGLNAGAPVTFRGVRLGEVKGVQAVLTGRPDELIQIEVVLEIRRDVIQSPTGVGRPWAALRDQALADAMIEAGLRGRMMSQSLLTGQKYIDFDIVPGEPPRLAGLRGRLPELATMPTALERAGERGEQLMARIAELPLDEMLDDVRQVVQGLRKLLGSEELKEAVAGARRITGSAETALVESRAAMADARRLIDALAGEVRETGNASREAVAEAREALARAQRTLDRIDRTAEGADEARAAAVLAMEELSRATRALRHLADYLQAHPEALLQGKPAREETR